MIAIDHSHLTINESDLTAEHIFSLKGRLAVSLTFSACTSATWKEVGEALSTLKELQLLNLSGCANSADAVVIGLVVSKNTILRCMRICTLESNTANCGLTDRGVRFLSRLDQLS